MSVLSRVFQPISRLPKPVQGAIWMAASALCLSLMHASIRHLSGAVHPVELVFFRYLFGILFMLPWLGACLSNGYGLR